jgi:hypothetical protein
MIIENIYGFFSWKNIVFDKLYIISFVSIPLSWVICKDECIISYSVTNDFSSECSKTINPNCPTVGIEWPIDAKIMSENDSKAKILNELLDEKIFF